MIQPIQSEQQLISENKVFLMLTKIFGISLLGILVLTALINFLNIVYFDDQVPPVWVLFITLIPLILCVVTVIICIFIFILTL